MSQFDQTRVRPPKVRPPMAIRPPFDTDLDDTQGHVRPPADAVRPPVRPPADTDDTTGHVRPPADSDRVRPPAESDRVRPPAEDDDDVEAHVRF